MDALFGDATTAMPTPQTRPENGALLGISSPVPSMDLRRGIMGGGPASANLGPQSAIPGLDIDPPHVNIKNGKPQYGDEDSTSEGVGGWISRMVNRGGDDSSRSSVKSGKYKPLGDDESGFAD